MLSWLVITFLPRSKRLLISWLQSPSAVILEPKKIKLATVSTVSPSISHEVMGPDAMTLVLKQEPRNKSTGIQFLGREDTLEKEFPTILAWEIPRMGSLTGYSPWCCRELDMTE